MEVIVSYIPYVGKALMLLGGFFLLTSAVGLLRFPDFMTRLHPAGITDSMGVPLVLLGVALQFPLGLVTVKIILLILFALVASATACHALAKASLVESSVSSTRLKAAKPKATKTKGKKK